MSQPTPNDHAGPLLEALAEGYRQDFAEGLELLDQAVAVFRLLEVRTKAVNGTSAVVRAQAAQIEQAAKHLRAEHDQIREKMLAAPREPVASKVDHEHAAKVLAAREAEAVPA